MKMLSELDVSLDSARLDRYYSSPSCVDSFDRATKVFVIPKKNARAQWLMEVEGDHDRIREEHDALSGGISSKKQFRIRICSWQKDARVGNRPEKGGNRIDCAQFCTGLWHNLFNLEPS